MTEAQMHIFNEESHSFENHLVWKVYKANVHITSLVGTCLPEECAVCKIKRCESRALLTLTRISGHCSRGVCVIWFYVPPTDLKQPDERLVGYLVTQLRCSDSRGSFRLNETNNQHLLDSTSAYIWWANSSSVLYYTGLSLHASMSTTQMERHFN